MADSFQPRFVDLVRNYTSTTGTGNFVLGAAMTGYRGFASALQAGESFYYSAIGIDKPGEFEIGRGTMQADGTIARAPAGGVFTNFTDGNKTLALVAAAEWFEGVEAGSAAAFSSAASRAALAAVTDTSKPAMLHEVGRAGLFVFDPANRSSEVAADTMQGIYVAPASDSSGASGAWVRRDAGPVEASWFGAVGDGVADDKPTIQAAIDYAGRVGGGMVRLGRGDFAVSDILLVFSDDVTLDARGATVISKLTWPAATFYLGGARGRVIGGTWKITSGDATLYHFDVEGSDCEIEGAYFLKEPETSGYTGYLRNSADGAVMRDCTSAGSNGIYCEASNSAFLSNSFRGPTAGGDDAIALKAIAGSTKNVRIIGNSFENLAYFCSMGSEIGTSGANDPTHSRAVSNVVVQGNIGTACSGILMIKPGAISTYDYRDGTVEGVVVSDNVLRDETGAKFVRGIAITAARGALVRNVTGKNNIVIARTHDDGGRHVGGLDIYIPDYSALSPAGPPTITDIDVGIAFNDPYDGAPSSASVPGVAASYVAAVEKDSPTYGTIANVSVDVAGNGCRLSGIYIQSGLDDAVFIRRAILTNIASDGSSVYGGIQYRSRIAVGNDVSIKMANGSSARAYKPDPGYSAAIVARIDLAFVATSIPAGVDSARAIRWAAHRNCFVHKVEVVNSTNVNQSADDTNYTQHEIRNESAAGINNAASSKLTGGKAFPVNQFNTIVDAASLSGAALTECFFSRGNRLSYTKNDFGSGNALTDAYLRIHWAPF